MLRPQLPATRLQTVQSLFTTWRHNKKGKRIPGHLWDAAVALVDEYSVSYVSKQLCLEYSELKRRYANRASGAFVELCPTTFPVGLRAEIILSNGNQMRLYGTDTVAELIHAFTR